MVVQSLFLISQTASYPEIELWKYSYRNIALLSCRHFQQIQWQKRLFNYDKWNANYIRAMEIGPNLHHTNFSRSLNHSDHQQTWDKQLVSSVDPLNWFELGWKLTRWLFFHFDVSFSIARGPPHCFISYQAYDIHILVEAKLMLHLNAYFFLEAKLK